MLLVGVVLFCSECVVEKRFRFTFGCAIVYPVVGVFVVPEDRVSYLAVGVVLDFVVRFSNRES